MDEYDIIELSVDLVKCANFRWMGGMRTLCGVRLKEGWQIDTWIQKFSKDESPVPDLSDPATLGCLLSMVRELARDDGAYALKTEHGWLVKEHRNRAATYCVTEGVALTTYILQA